MIEFLIFLNNIDTCFSIVCARIVSISPHIPKIFLQNGTAKCERNTTGDHSSLPLIFAPLYGYIDLVETGIIRPRPFYSFGRSVETAWSSAWFRMTYLLERDYRRVAMQIIEAEQ